MIRPPQHDVPAVTIPETRVPSIDAHAAYLDACRRWGAADDRIEFDPDWNSSEKETVRP